MMRQEQGQDAFSELKAVSASLSLLIRKQEVASMDSEGKKQFDAELPAAAKHAAELLFTHNREPENDTPDGSARCMAFMEKTIVSTLEQWADMDDPVERSYMLVFRSNCIACILGIIEDTRNRVYS